MNRANNDLVLTVATDDYDHVRDFANGVVRAEGFRTIHLTLPVEEIFYRFTAYDEWDVSEYSLAKYVSRRSQGDDSITAIPVFPSRVFRLSAFYVRADGGPERLEELAGRRVGIPEWSMTATVYARAYLMHEAGVPLADIDWVQAGLNEAGREEAANLKLPAGVRYTSEPERTLSDMLRDGDIDAIIAARPPQAFVQGEPWIARLMPDHRQAEATYFGASGIFPIMHTIAIRSAVLDRHPWVARNLMSAFEEAKRRSVARTRDVTASRFPVPWGFDDAARAAATFGADVWPYGIEPNRATLEAFLQFAYEQGVAHAPLTVEDLFCETVRRGHKV